MKIRLASSNDIGIIEKIYEDARVFMRQSGNMYQWQGIYPSRENIISDINDSCLCLCCESELILGVFYFRIGEDVTYQTIYDGKWLNESEYAVIHRIAVSSESRGKGVASFCFDYALSKFPNIKIDTHKDNIPMQKALTKNGFSYCGIIHLLNGEERMAYQRSI